jgi:hypothetical protein
MAMDAVANSSVRLRCTCMSHPLPMAALLLPLLRIEDRFIMVLPERIPSSRSSTMESIRRSTSKYCCRTFIVSASSVSRAP